MQSSVLNSDISKYIKDIDAIYRTGRAAEHSYRGGLQSLLTTLCPHLTVTNEPQRIACGAPDYILSRGEVHVGHVEAKDIGINLSSRTHKEQFDRYRASLENLIITDYLEFRFFRNGEQTATVRIGEVVNGKIRPLLDEFEKFVRLIEDFSTWYGQTITSPEKLAKIMAGKARLLADIIKNAVTSDEKTHNNTNLLNQLRAFQKILIHDLTPASFADLYAQTIAYGMFAARLHDTTLDTFTRHEAATLIPQSDPFLRKLFQDIGGYDLDPRITWIVDELADIFRATDITKILADFGKKSGHDDAFTYFYEDFLAAYDPRLRKSRGVWYTPEPVVRFIVRAVDDILKTEFNLPQGLADSSTTQIKVETQSSDKRFKEGIRTVEKTVHRVQVLDPATGTGTFLAEVIRLVHSKFTGQQGIWPQYAEKHLIPRLNGFEILMASYAMAHLKLDLVLRETGYVMSQPLSGSDMADTFQDLQRLRVFLTNSLEEAHPDTGTLFASWLSQEATEANIVKRETPVMVVLGNPPYTISSSNKGKWIQDSLHEYKKNLNEKKLNLDDDYIKFIRYGQLLISKNGEGILAYITNNSFIDGVTHRRMRESLLRSFDSIYILNLHGNSRKGERAEDGSKDENVFDIMQGVSINIFIKKSQSKREYGTINYASISGLRNLKYSQLEGLTLANIEWQQLPSSKPTFLFVPFDTTGSDRYSLGVSVNHLFVIQNSGLKTDRDSLFIDIDLENLSSRVEYLLSGDISAEFSSQFNVKDSGSYKITSAIIGKLFSKNNLHKNHYRPFDGRWVYYDPEIISRPALRVMKHMIHNTNVSLALPRQVPNSESSGALVSKGLCGHKVFSAYNINTVFPLYLYPDATNQTSTITEGVQPNLDQELVEKLAEAASLTYVFDPENLWAHGEDERLTPLDVLDYCYAALHSPEYRETYKEFLKSDFPRIPYPKDATQFRALVQLGARLRQLHLLEADDIDEFITTYPIGGSNEVTRRMTKKSIGFEATSNELGRVWINDEQYFDQVPLTAWEFYIGGYQPAQKWLKDRRDRELSFDDIRHYQRIIVALEETRKVMEEIDVIGVV